MLTRREAAGILGAGALAIGLRAKAAVAAAALAHPRASDVCFSPRGTNPAALPFARACGATRIEWTYSLDHDFLAAFRNVGVGAIGGTINACMPDKVGGNTYQVGRQQDRNGQLIYAPWMAGEPVKRAWGCPNNPAYEQILAARALAALSAGADHLQFDDAAMSIPAVAWGGCWCSYCKKRAAGLGYSLDNQMLAFQTRSTVDFIGRLRTRINSQAGRTVPMSANNFNGSRSQPYTLFDFGMCELEAERLRPDQLISMYRSFEADGWFQAVTLKSTDPRLSQSVIATIHACGGSCIVPWDVFLATGRRYFGTVSDYAGVYRTIRHLGALLDGKRFSARSPNDLLSTNTIAQLAAQKVQVIAREDASSLVLHFVPWGPAGATIHGTVRDRYGARSALQFAGDRAAAAISPRSFSIPTDVWSALAIEKA